MELGPPSLTTRGVLGQTLAVGPIFSAAFVGGTAAVFAGFNTLSPCCWPAWGRRDSPTRCCSTGAASPTRAVSRSTCRGASIPPWGRGRRVYLLGLLFLGAGGGFVADGYLMNDMLQNELSLDLGWWVWALVFLALAIGIN